MPNHFILYSFFCLISSLLISHYQTQSKINFVRLCFSWLPITNSDNDDDNYNSNYSILKILVKEVKIIVYLLRCVKIYSFMIF